MDMFNYDENEEQRRKNLGSRSFQNEGFGKMSRDILSSREQRINRTMNTLRNSAEPKKDAIPFLGGRPERDTVVANTDEMLNLEIAFNTAGSFEEFLSLI